MTTFQHKMTIKRLNDCTDISRDLSMNLIGNQRYYIRQIM